MLRIKSTPLIIIVLFFNCIIEGQTTHNLSGTITDCKYKKVIKDATIKLVCQNGRTYITNSDSLGKYFFNDTVLKPNLAYVINVLAPILDKSTNSYGSCPYDYCYSTLEYFNSDKEKFKTDDSLLYKKYIHDFCLVEMLKCGWSLPDLYFKNNSIDFSKGKMNYYNYETADTVMDCLIGFMYCNPKYTIEIRGSADKTEKNAQQLSEQRVKKVFNIFIEKGIDKERLYCKAYGAKRPAEKISDEGKLIGTLSGAINRRVIFSLVSKDYNPSKK